ncbi:DUF2235 domain-containing protein [Undibacterium sp. TJN25]|uniref:DUF2235 domain-containing protein n=1 Tax=Undibacterium sp. TJN25 TaxID=3413056 RepID=UPI003BF2E260
MKRILVFSDGTGNSSAKAQKTNVWRLFQAVDQAMPDQLAKYDDGVGTSSNKYLAALGGVFGYGLKRNVIDLYKFICRNYVGKDGEENNDEIYGFGFSRGAFTIRMLIGLIDNQGLVPFGSEEELHSNAVLAYRRFRDKRFTSRSPFVWLGRRLRDSLLWPFNRTANAALKKARRNIPFQFLGLWDTVAAYGMPVDELKWGISLLIWPMVTADRTLSKNVRRACHALSLDDQRLTFHPILFDESRESISSDSTLKRITQVWFPGAHSNVGGGYPEDQLSLVSFDWMVSQLRGTGLRLDSAVLKNFAEDRSAYARIYDSRSGVASYYRYAPRSLEMGCDINKKPIVPTVHGSVVMRMAYGSDAYAPISLPSTFNVLAPDGTLLTMHGFTDIYTSSSPPSAQPATTVGDPAARTDALKNAIASLNPPEQPVDPEMVRQVHDTVWWRRVTYFACLFSTLSVVAFPYAAGLYSKVAKFILSSIPWIGTSLVKTLGNWSRCFTIIWQGWTTDLFQLADSVVPTPAKAWLQALKNQPLEMLAALVLVVISYGAGQFLAQRIHDRSRYAWHRSNSKNYLDWAVRSSKSSLIKSIALTILGALLLLIAWFSGTSSKVWSTILMLILISSAVIAWRTAILCRVLKDTDLVEKGGHSLPSTPTLKVARFMRCNVHLICVWEILADRLIPLLFALALGYAIVGISYHTILRAASSAGAFCSEQSEVGATTSANFDATKLCWASARKVQQGHGYQLTLTKLDSWSDGSVSIGVGGVSAPTFNETLVYALAEPMKRSWSGQWFQPIARVGRLGDVEYPMTTMASSAKTASVRFIAKRDGEIFLYVNDAILLVPSKANQFYSNNKGYGSLAVCELAGPLDGNLTDKALVDKNCLK